MNYATETVASETVTCKCGHTDTLRAFTIRDDIPGVFHCPSCKWRWIRELKQVDGGWRVVLREYRP